MVWGIVLLLGCMSGSTSVLFWFRQHPRVTRHVALHVCSSNYLYSRAPYTSQPDPPLSVSPIFKSPEQARYLPRNPVFRGVSMTSSRTDAVPITEMCAAPEPANDRLLVDIIDGVALTNPDDAWLEYPTSATDYSAGFSTITYRSLANATNALAWHLHRNISPGTEFQTLAYIGPNDARYAVILYACIKAGFKVSVTDKVASSAYTLIVPGILLVTEKQHLGSCPLVLCPRLLDAGHHRPHANRRRSPLVPACHESGIPSKPRRAVTESRRALSVQQNLCRGAK